jgi:hypothetical protein
LQSKLAVCVWPNIPRFRKAHKQTIDNGIDISVIATTTPAAAPSVTVLVSLFRRKRCELPRPPGGYDRVLKRVGIQYCRISSTTAGMSL